MRNRKIIFGLGAALTLGLSTLALVSNQPTRSPASKNSSWRPQPLGKHLAFLHVELTTDNEIPDFPTDEVTLTARILVNQNLVGDLGYEWILPEDVSIIEGNASDTLAGVKIGQIVEQKITVTGFSKEKQATISFSAKALNGNQLLGNSAMIVSRREDTLEAAAPRMKKSAEVQLGEKVFKGRRKAY